MVLSGEGSVRRAALTSVAPAPADQEFQLDFFARSEDGLMVAKSLFGLAAQDFRIDKDRWKLVADNSDSINMALLRQQQQRLALIRALGVFCSHQTILRYPFIPLTSFKSAVGYRTYLQIGTAALHARLEHNTLE